MNLLALNYIVLNRSKTSSFLAGEFTFFHFFNVLVKYILTSARRNPINYSTFFAAKDGEKGT